MSVSDNSTLPVARESEASYQSLDGHAYGVGGLPVSSYEKSPYADPEIISLDVGSSQTRYRVHRAVLSQSSELEAKPALKLWGEKTNDTISLPELDETTAHTLIHYLYSGSYQSLQSYEQVGKSAVDRYKLGTCVYCAAMRYKLVGLAELAKEKITSFGEDLTILEILGVARENAFPLLPEDETWFPAYVEDAIKSAVSDDSTLFTNPEFIDQIEGDRKFRQVVMKAIVDSCSKAPTVPSPGQPEVAASVSEISLDQSVQSQPPVTEPQPVTPSLNRNLTNGSAELEQKPTTTTNDVKLDEIEPTIESQALEQFTDELDSRNSKTFQKLSKKPESPVNTQAPVNPPTTKPAHTRSDSVMNVVETVTIPPVKEKKVSEPVEDAKVIAPTEAKKVIVPGEDKQVASPEVPDASPLVVDGTNGNTTPSKKSKKKNKKKASSAVAAGGGPTATVTA